MAAAMIRLSCLFLCAEGLKYLDLGAPRTGTQSMYAAFQMMGYRALHSGYNQSVRIPWCNYLFNNGSLELALSSLNGFDVAMDEPLMLIYEEVMEHFPESKFILTISEPESWHDNYVELYDGMRDSPDMQQMYFLEDTLPENLANAVHQCNAMVSWGCDFKNPTEASKETCINSYKQHIARVQQVIPPHRLLVYNWSDGCFGAFCLAVRTLTFCQLMGFPY